MEIRSVHLKVEVLKLQQRQNDRDTIRPVTVQVHFLKPLEYEDYKEMKTTEIAALVEKQIQETIDANVEE